jgi:maltokinase
VPPLDDLPGKLAPLLGRFLPRQRWYAGSEAPARVEVTVLDLVGADDTGEIEETGRGADTGATGRTGEPRETGEKPSPVLAWLLVDVTDDAGATATYQVVLGGRPAPCDDEFLQGKDRVTVGEIDDRVWYDALVDPELSLEVLRRVAPDESASVARPLVVEQSNSSVVYDEHLILKLFRRVHPEPNPDVEITEVLNDRGFPHVVPQLAVLRHGEADLAVVRAYLLGSTDAWQLAHTSLRDLLGTRLPPEEAGGDFGPEAFTLGEVTARLHVAMADAFGTTTADPAGWLAQFRAQLARVPEVIIDVRDEPVRTADLIEVAAVDTVLAGLLVGVDPGPAFHVHGDLHLGQFLLADAGWFVLDFEGEPVRPVAERMTASSALRDVAGMVRSFHYAARTALAERGRDVDTELVELTDAWERRAVEAYLAGYRHVEGVEDLLPSSDEDQMRVLRAFELDKAVYEILYELAHRPDWVDIPASAVRRTLSLVG